MPAKDESTQIAEITAKGLAAALSLAAALDMPAAEPAVLSSRGNLLVHLAPWPVVARVATLTAWSRREPFAWLAREVTVARHVCSRSGPVASPTRQVDPGPYWRDGLAISLWDYVPPSPVRPVPAEVGTALARLHGAAAGCTARLGDLSPAREQISEGLDALEHQSVLDRRTIATLRARHAEVLASLETPVQTQTLHGDAHAGNLLWACGGWRWIDLEETCRGPVHRDLAVLAEDSGTRADEALAAYAEQAASDVPTVAELAPFRRARMLEATV